MFNIFKTVQWSLRTFTADNVNIERELNETHTDEIKARLFRVFKIIFIFRSITVHENLIGSENEETSMMFAS